MNKESENKREREREREKGLVRTLPDKRERKRELKRQPFKDGFVKPSLYEVKL